MIRRPKTSRVPRTRAGGTWTEAGYFGFLRSGLRQLSRRWPPIANTLRGNRRPYTGPNKRQKWEYLCTACGHWFSAKEVSVDHVTPCGRLSSMDDVRTFVERLFCESDGLRVVCNECHDAITKGSRT